MSNELSLKQRQIQERRLKVKRLYLRKLTVVEIANNIGVDEKTIDRDLQWMREENMQILKRDMEMQSELQGAVVDHLQAIDEIIRESWSLYHQPNTEQKTRTGLLRNLKDAYAERIQIFFKLGLAPTAPLKIQAEVTPSSEIEQMGSGMKSRVSEEFRAFMQAKYALPLDEWDAKALESALMKSNPRAS